MVCRNALISSHKFFLKMDPIIIKQKSYAGFKPPAKIEDVFIWRLQIILTTNTKSDSDTDSGVYVQFATGEKNKFWLDRAINDREKGMTTAYDVVMSKIRKVSDLKFLSLGIAGWDGWNIKTIKLVINNDFTIFEKSYGTAGIWLEKEGNKKHVLTIPSAELRNHSKWKPSPQQLLVMSLPPFVIPREMLESVIECRMGHEIENNNKYPSEPKMKQLYWGKISGRPVEVKRKSANTLSVDLDLAADVSWLPDPSVDVDFDIKLGCKDKRISAEIANVKANVDSLLFDVVNFLVPFGDVIKTSFNFNLAFSAGINIPTKCPKFEVDANGNIKILEYYI